MTPQVAQLETGPRQAGVAGESLPVGAKRLLHPAGILERGAQAVVCQRELGGERDRLLDLGDGLRALAEGTEQDAQTAVRLDVVGL
jgi:hypothetical protein